MSVLPDALIRHAASVEAEMRATVDAAAATGGLRLPIHDMARYALGWIDQHGAPAAAAGKRARPALCMLGAAAITADPGLQAPALCGAAAVEFVHNFSLVHDDIQDQDEQRRGRPTVWKVWGIGQAINAGDALREFADLAMLRAADAGAPPQAILDAAARLNRATLRMIEGQYLDLTFEERRDVELDEYMRMVERKTGAMMGVSVAIGATLAGASAHQADALQLAGQRLGRCFQIRDDWLGIWADAAALGKSTDSDIRRKKKSYPILWTLRNGTSAVRDTLLDAWRKPQLDDADVSAVHALLDESGAADAANSAAEHEYDAFRSALLGCDPRPEAVAELEAVAAFTLQRDR